MRQVPCMRIGGVDEMRSKCGPWELQPVAWELNPICAPHGRSSSLLSNPEIDLTPAPPCAYLCP